MNEILVAMVSENPTFILGPQLERMEQLTIILANSYNNKLCKPETKGKMAQLIKQLA